jgi:hypothetical protein
MRSTGSRVLKVFAFELEVLLAFASGRIRHNPIPSWAEEENPPNAGHPRDNSQ